MKAFLILLPLLSTGCAALPLATLGTLFGIAGSAASTGTDVYSAGKLDAAELHPVQPLRASAFLAAADLEMTPVFDKPDKFGSTIRFTDARESTLDVSFDSRTPVLTRVRINVGLFGHEPTARIFLEQMRTHLPPTTNEHVPPRQLTGSAG